MIILLFENLSHQLSTPAVNANNSKYSIEGFFLFYERSTPASIHPLVFAYSSKAIYLGCISVESNFMGIPAF